MDKHQIAYLAQAAEEPIQLLADQVRASPDGSTRSTLSDAHNALLEIRDALDRELGGRETRLAIYDANHPALVAPFDDGSPEESLEPIRRRAPSVDGAIRIGDGV